MMGICNERHTIVNKPCAQQHAQDQKICTRAHTPSASPVHRSGFYIRNEQRTRCAPVAHPLPPSLPLPPPPGSTELPPLMPLVDVVALTVIYSGTSGSGTGVVEDGAVRWARCAFRCLVAAALGHRKALQMQREPYLALQIREGRVRHLTPCLNAVYEQEQGVGGRCGVARAFSLGNGTGRYG